MSDGTRSSGGRHSTRSIVSSSGTESTRSSGRITLYELCRDTSESDWGVIRDWFATNGRLDASDAASFRGRDGTTALHLVCRNYAPLDIVKLLVDANPNALDWEDEFGWLPLHYACHHGINEQVVNLLVSQNASSVNVTDKKGRNPLHFAVGNVGKQHGLFQSSIFSSLAQHGAINVADNKGMMPLHYACAYGASVNTLEILIQAFPKALAITDNNGFLPLHYALSNCDKEECALNVKALLAHDKTVMTIDFDHKHHPLYVLANRANRLKDKKLLEGQANACKSMNLFLDLGPLPTTNFFAALHTMPKWLLEKAVVHPKVQELLNHKMSMRFPTAIMMIDFYAISTVLLSFAFLVIESIDLRADASSEDNGVKSSKLAPLYISAIYFAVRELIQVISFIHLGLFSVWFRRGTNWLEIGLIVLILFWAAVLNTGVIPLDAFRTWASISTFFFWLNFLNFLRGLLVEFAVFVSGVIHVVQRLGPFLLALIIILIAFMQMFYVVFQGTGYCDGYDDEKTFVDECDPENTEPYRFCSNWRTFLVVYTMLLGEVDEADFEMSQFATLLFVVFIFLVVILLANVLIAIVTDSYSVIRKERAAIVFWTSRLDFIVEMDVISSGIKSIGFGRINSHQNEENKDEETSAPSNRNPTILWKSITNIFDKDLNRMEVWSLSFLCLTLVRITIIFIVIPLWIVLGLLTAGSAWPDQWRKKILEQNITVHNHSSSIPGLKKIMDDLEDLQQEVKTKLASNQAIANQLRTDVASIETTVNEDLKEICKVMANFLETQKMLYD